MNVPKGKEKRIYIKFCKLVSCGKKFETTRDWQEFCSNEHRTKHWTLYRTSEYSIRRELSEVIKNLKDLKARVTKLEEDEKEAR